MTITDIYRPISVTKIILKIQLMAKICLLNSMIYIFNTNTTYRIRWNKSISRFE